MQRPKAGSAALQQGLEELACVAGRALGHFLRCAGDHYLAAPVTALRPEVDQPVGSLYHIEVVLDDDHRIALFDQAVEHPEQLADIFEMQAGGRFVENVQRPAGRTFRQLGRQFYPLSLAPRKGRGRLAKSYVPETDVYQGLHVARNDRLVGKVLGRLLAGQVEDIGDVLTLEGDI